MATHYRVLKQPGKYVTHFYQVQKLGWFFWHDIGPIVFTEHAADELIRQNQTGQIDDDGIELIKTVTVKSR